MTRKSDTKDSRATGNRVVPERGTISGSGVGMPDEQALSILRNVEPGPARNDPDIEVVVGAKEQPAQVEIPLSMEKHEADAPAKAFKKMSMKPGLFTVPVATPPPLPDIVPRIVIQRMDLHSSLRSVLDRAKALRLAEDAFGHGESLRMRLLMDRSTIDLDLSQADSEDLEASLSDLIDKSID
jgi:hypothetical protein